MKTILLLLLVLPRLSYSQDNDNPLAQRPALKDTTVKPVSLPSLLRSDLTKVYEVGTRSSYRYVVNSDSVYHRIFSRYHKDSLPVFDFTKQELLVAISCHYCSGPGSLNGKPRHRNACAYRDFWFVRDKAQSTH